MVELAGTAHCCTADTTPSPDSAPEDPPLVLLTHLNTGPTKLELMSALNIFKYKL